MTFKGQLCLRNALIISQNLYFPVKISIKLYVGQLPEPSSDFCQLVQY
jgi:hypothetical protein